MPARDPAMVIRWRLYDTIEEEWNKEITIYENGEEITITIREALAKKFLRQCMSMDTDILKLLFKIIPTEKRNDREVPTRFVMNMGNPRVQEKVDKA